MNPAFAKLSLTFIFHFFIFQIIYSQSPGGVSTNLTFWAKSNASSGKITLLAGNKVSSWINEKSAFAINQATSAKQPVWNEASASTFLFNYNPYIKFDNTSSNYLSTASTSPDLAGTTPTIFLISTDASSQSALTYYSTSAYRYQIKPQFRVQSSSGAATGYYSNLPNLADANAYITVLRNNAASINGRRNSAQYSLTNSGAGFFPAIGAGLNIGANPSNGEYFGGTISEVIMYNSVLSNAAVQQVESYLGIKYGFTFDRTGLSFNYYNSSGTSIYADGPDAGAYWSQIIGIVGDSASGGGALYQRQSHQSDDSTRIYLGSLQASNNANTSSFTNNVSSIVIANNQGNLCSSRGAYISQHPPSVPVRLDREWKIKVTGSTATTNVHE